MQNLSLEFKVKDDNRFRVNETIGQIRIGPNDEYSHWEEMKRNHGTVVKREHPLKIV